MSLQKYFASLFITLVVVSAGLSFLPALSNSHVSAGTEVEEHWKHDFVLPAVGTDVWIVDEPVKASLERDLKFVGSGPVQIVSSSVKVTAKEVSWSEGKNKRIKAPGGELVSTVRWKAAPNAQNGAVGDISPKHPELRLAFHNGGYQISGGRTMLREVTVYQGAAATMVGRFFFANWLALPAVMMLHSGWILFTLHRQKKKQAALPKEEPAQENGSGTQTFVPDPNSEFSTWLMTLAIIGFVGTMIVFFSVLDGMVGSNMTIAFKVIAGFGFILAAILAWWVRRTVATVRINADSIAIAKGRGSKWNEARWSEMKAVKLVQWKYKGQLQERLDIVFPNGKKFKITKSFLPDYPLIRDAALSLYSRNRGDVP